MHICAECPPGNLELTMSREHSEEAAKASNKTSSGNFFEDFRVGDTIRHATPRTVTVGDVALYIGLFGSRFAVQSSDAFAQAIAYPRAPVDDLLAFHLLLRKTGPAASPAALARLGPAACPDLPAQAAAATIPAAAAS